MSKKLNPLRMMCLTSIKMDTLYSGWYMYMIFYICTRISYNYKYCEETRYGQVVEYRIRWKAVLVRNVVWAFGARTHSHCILSRLPASWRDGLLLQQFLNTLVINSHTYYTLCDNTVSLLYCLRVWTCSFRFHVLLRLCGQICSFLKFI